MKKSDKFIIGTVVGGAIGSILGLLFAPKTGKETRQDVADVSKKAYEWSKDKAGVFKEEHKDELDEAMEKLHLSVSKVGKSFKALKKQAFDQKTRKLTKSRKHEGKDA